jgi:phytoene synthase
MANDPEDLDALVKRVDPDRWLSSRFIGDAQARADVVALYAYDHELARAPKVTTNPLMGEIRLAWWREVLDEVFEGRPVRRHATAQALADVVRRHGLPRAPLEAMIDARYRQLDPAPLTADEAGAWAADTGGAAAVLAARLLDPSADPEPARSAGAAWALAHRLAVQPDLAPVFQALLKAARRDVHRLSIPAFPAAAHVALARGRAKGGRAADLRRRLALTWAVARGRV